MNVHIIEQFDFLFVFFLPSSFFFSDKPALAFSLLIYFLILAQEHVGAF